MTAPRCEIAFLLYIYPSCCLARVRARALRREAFLPTVALLATAGPRATHTAARGDGRRTQSITRPGRGDRGRLRAQRSPSLPRAPQTLRRELRNGAPPPIISSHPGAGTADAQQPAGLGRTRTFCATPVHTWVTRMPPKRETTSQMPLA
eukprot:352239-Chlamydomonas_euryale.AAC.7